MPVSPQMIINQSYIALARSEKIIKLSNLLVVLTLVRVANCQKFDVRHQTVCE